MAKTCDALKILDRLTGDDPALHELIAEESVNAQVARMIFEARTQAGLTQTQLAQKLGTSQPVIARLEDAEYKGHSLNMLRRVGEVFGRHLEIRWAGPEQRRRKEQTRIAV